MKRTTFLVIALAVYGFMSHCSIQAGKLSAGSTVSWYKIKDTDIFDVSGTRDHLVDSSAKAVPGFFVSWQTKTAIDCCQKWHALWGLKFGLNTRKRSAIADYKEGGSAVEFAIKQHVTDLHFTPFAGIERTVTYFKNVTVGASAGCSIGRKILDAFRVYHKTTDAYCGQNLRPQNINFMGEFTMYGFKEFANSYSVHAGYSISFGHIKYGKQVFTETPDQNAPAQFNALALLNDSGSVFLEKDPAIKLYRHTLGLSLAKEF